MFIFNLFSVGFSLLCHSVVFALCFFSFVKQKTVTLHVRLREKSETKSNKNTRTYFLYMKKGVSSTNEKISQK